MARRSPNPTDPLLPLHHDVPEPPYLRHGGLVSLGHCQNLHAQMDRMERLLVTICEQSRLNQTSKPDLWLERIERGTQIWEVVLATVAFVKDILGK
jgi:hypothetical protein